MRIIDLYVSEVGRRLPAKIRSDIEAELKSTLLDMLEDKSQKENRAADESLAKELLKEYGSPEKVASTYLPEKYLISPRIYPTFVMILKIVLVVLLFASVLGMGVQLGQSAFSLEQSAVLVGKTFLGLFQAAIQALGTLVIVFTLVERFMPTANQMTSDWKPDDLLKIEEPDKVKMVEVILSIVFTTLALVIFNFYPNLISVYIREGNGWVSYPILTAAFFRLLLWLNIIWVLEITLNGLVLRDGIWTKTTRLFEIGIHLLNVALLVVMATGPSIVQLPVDWMVNLSNLGQDTAQLVETQFSNGFRTVLGLVAAIVFLDTLRKVYRVWKK
jgi:hypothetical protein